MISTLLFALLNIANIIGNGVGIPVGDTEQPFTFPEDGQIQPRLIANVSQRPPCANGSTLCADVSDYPKDYVKNVLRNSINSYLPYFGVDSINEPEISQKVDGVDEYTMCPSYEDIVYPKYAKGKDQKWIFVVNEPPHVQGVRIEKCLKPDNPCLFSENTDHNLYKTSCKQKYIYRKMVSFKEGGDAAPNDILIPSCCVCSVKTVGLAERFGGGSRPPVTPATSPKPK